MSEETSNETKPPAAVPTGYRVSVVPGAIEVSARLGDAVEVRELMKVLRAGILVFGTDGDADVQENLSHRVGAIRAATLKR